MGDSGGGQIMNAESQKLFLTPSIISFFAIEKILPKSWTC
jgi:hypothetical protein